MWRAGAGEVEVVFVGRGAPADRGAALRRLEGGERPVAWLEQRHTAICLQAAAGSCGEGDALWTNERGLALCVVTADCVPVALAGAAGVAVAHAGWRGIVAGVVGRAAAAVGADAPGSRAWIGPAIGSCCYEVGGDVGEKVTAASGPDVLMAQEGEERPRLDLVLAVARQLAAAGVPAVQRLGPCTRCSPDVLHSYRRDGPGAGRNLTFVWRRARAAD